MFAFLKSIVSSFWLENDDTDLSLDEAYNVLSNAEETEFPEGDLQQQQQNDCEDYACYHKSGTITASREDYYTIDDCYEFKSQLENLAVGMQVSFTVYTVNGTVKVTDVAIKDDWSFQGSDNKKSSWTSRTLICNVNKREGRLLYVMPGDINIDLNSINSEFIPIVGDWIELQAKVELDENISDLFGKVLEIEKIRPLRPRVLEGCVKEWCNDKRVGVIDRVVYFNGDALSPGYVPMVGDKVVIETIESDQGRYTCRALKVVPQKQMDKQVTLPNTFLSHHEFEDDNNGVYISNNVFLNAVKLREKLNYKFDVCNKSKDNLILLKLETPSSSSQCEIIKPDSFTNITIKPEETIEINGLCTVKNMGTTKELVLFSFENFNIGRWITVNLESSSSPNGHHQIERARSVNKGSFLLANSRFKLKKGEVVRGQHLTAAPRFISARLPDYPVPQKLYNIFIENSSDGTKKDAVLKGEICKMKPCLNMPLAFNIYEDYFHTLIHLDEIHQIIAVKAYEQDQTLFIRNVEYMMLEIENLSEKRPSLIPGDRIIAKDSYDVDATEYEGIIHKVGAKHIYIKFAQNFHDVYNGEDMSIMVITTRTTFRRMHQAVGLAIRNLGSGFLFPTKVIQKNPQINFTYDQYSVEQNGIIDFNTTKLTRTQKALATLKRHSLEQKNVNSNSSASEEEKSVNSSEENDSSPVKSQLLLTVPEETNKTKKSPQHHSLTLLKLEWYNNNLNYYQKEAVRNILVGEARPLPYLIFGPPGTGKTVTLVETILQILRLIPHSRLLVAAPSNSAANLIALRLIESGILKPGDIIRLVAFRCVAEDTLPVKLIPYCATADLARDGTNANGLNVTSSGLTLGCNSSVIGRHRITVGTCVSLGILYNMGFSKGHFTHIIVDEAGQATEPEIMIPFALLDVSAGQIILAGDPQQLGPVVLSKVAAELGLEETYLDRMLSRFPYIRDSEGFPDTGGYDPRLITRLVYNYRSLPNVLKLSSDLFYDGQLISTISPVNSKEAELLNSLKEILPCRDISMPPSVVFHGVIGENYQTPECPSWFNPNEVSQIFYYVNEFYRLGLKSTDIGIISPYLKQVRQIRALLIEAEFEVPKVGTVEDFQGQEFNVILLSTVRSNENFRTHDFKYKLGFISNPRRVNVAITRAQALMIVVGNPHLLCHDPHWRSVIKYCIDNGAYRGCDLISS